MALPGAAAAHQAASAQGRPGSGQAATLRAQGEAAMEASRFGEAEAVYQQLVGLTPADAIAHMQLGMARAMGGRSAEAIAPLREALRLRPDLLPAKLFLGITYLETGRPGDAVGPLRQVVQADAGNVNARQALAEALLALDRVGEASVELEALAAAQADSPQVWAVLGRAYEGVAREAFARLQAIDPDSPYVWLLVADVLTVEEKYPQAFSLVRKAQEALPALPGVHQTLARVYAASGHADWAATEQARADTERPACDSVPVACAYLAGKPRDVIARTMTASQAAALYWRARAANDLAGQAFEKLEKLPPSVERYVMRAGIARDHGEPLEAAAQLREALKLSPGDPGLERELAGALYAARDYEAALPLLEKLHGLAPKAPDSAGRARRSAAAGTAARQGRGPALTRRSRRPIHRPGPRLTRAGAGAGWRAGQGRASPREGARFRRRWQRALPAGAGDAAHRSARQGQNAAGRVPEAVAGRGPAVDSGAAGRRDDHASGSVTSTTVSIPGASTVCMRPVGQCTSMRGTVVAVPSPMWMPCSTDDA